MQLVAMTQDEGAPGIVVELALTFALPGLTGPEDARRAADLPGFWKRFFYDTVMLSPRFAEIRRRPEVQADLPEWRARFGEGLAVVEAAHERGELPSFYEQPLADLRALLAEHELGVTAESTN